MLDKQQEQMRDMNVGAHLRRAADAMERAANAATWEQARAHMKAAADSLKNASATVSAPR